MAIKRTQIKRVLQDQKTGEKITVKGWVRSFRNNQFIALNDGSTLDNIQVVIDRDNTDDEIKKRLHPGTAIRATGVLVGSRGRGQAVEIQADEIGSYGESDPETYPLQPTNKPKESPSERAHM